MHLDSPSMLEPIGSRARWAESIFGLPGIFICACFGLLLGVVIEQNDPSDTAIVWIGTVGELFLRAVGCLVAPLVFCSLVESLLDLFEDGRAARVSKIALLLYALTTVVATCEGLAFALVFKYAFKKPDWTDTIDSERVTLQLACGGNDTDMFLHHFADGSIRCAAVANSNSSGVMSSVEAEPWTFWVYDVNGSFALSTASSSTSDERITSATVSESLTDTIQAQLYSLVPNSIAAAFVDGDLLSIVTFATLFTVALAAPGHRRLDNLADVIRDLNAALMRMISWIVRFWTPFAILSLLASAIGGSTDLSTLVKNAGLYVLCDLCALAVHTYGFYPLLLWIAARTRKPYAWLAKMFRAQLFALGCASSMATLPVVMTCVEKTRIMPMTLSRFLLSIGATVGKDGAAASYPIAVLFLATAQGISLSATQIVSVAVLSAIGSVATGPVPAAGIIMIAAIWRSVMSTDPPMELFSLIVGTDWLLDRFQTVVNVTCDTIVCRIIAEHVVQKPIGGEGLHDVADRRSFGGNGYDDRGDESFDPTAFESADSARGSNLSNVITPRRGANNSVDPYDEPYQYYLDSARFKDSAHGSLTPKGGNDSSRKSRNAVDLLQSL